jgi:hypothetical protein
MGNGTLALMVPFEIVLHYRSVAIGIYNSYAKTDNQSSL